MKVLGQFPEYAEFRTRTQQRKGQPPPETQKPNNASREDLSPREAIEDVIDSAHSAVAADLLARVLSTLAPQAMRGLTGRMQLWSALVVNHLCLICYNTDVCCGHLPTCLTRLAQDWQNG